MRPLIISLCLFGFLLAGSTIVADTGITTSDTTSRGQVRVRNEDGVMYLTTETNDGAITTQTIQNEVVTGSASRSLGRTALNSIWIELPEGFATTVSGVINGVLSFVMLIAALLVFFYLILGAFQWITSGGDKSKVEQARNKITSAVVGLIILAASFAILNLALAFLGFSSLNDVFQSAGTIEGAPPATTDRVYETELQEVIEATPSATPGSN